MRPVDDEAGHQTRTSMAARIRPQHVVDILFAVTLTTLAMSGWASTFAGPGWWIASIAATVLGIAIAVAITDAGGGVQWVLLTLIGLYLLIAGPLALGRVELIRLSTFEEGMTETGSSWLTLMTTHPPVDAQGAVLLPPVLLSLFGPALSVSLSIRSRRMLAPIVPPGLTFVAVILMGQHNASSVVGQGLVFAGVAVLWMRVRALREEESDTGRDPARGRRIGASVALILAASMTVATAAGPPPELEPGPTSGISSDEIAPVIADTKLDPPPGADRFLLRDQATAYDPEQLVTPLDHFRDFTQQDLDAPHNLYDDRLLRVEGAPAGSRVRFAALDTYDGKRWETENETDPLRLDDRFLAVSSTIDNPADGDRAEVTVTLSGKWDLPWVPTVGSLQSFDFDRSASADPDALRYNPATSTAVMEGKPATQDRYTLTTRITEYELERDDAAAPYFDKALFNEADFLDVATAIGRLGSTGRIDALFAIAADLRQNGRYSDGAGLEGQIAAGQSRDRLGAKFINGFPTVGNDEQYAAAFALIANRLRIPARVVVGAVVPPNGAILGRDVQAWVEVRIADGSWRTVPTETFMSREPLTAPAGSLEPQPRDLTEPPDPSDTGDQEEPDAQNDADSGRADRSSRPDLTWLTLLALPVLALAITPALLKAWRRRRRRRAPTGAGKYAGAWAELIDRARDLGHEVPQGLTRPAQARLLDRAGHLAGIADRQTFASVDPPTESATEFWTLVDAERSELTRQATSRRRWWARFTPRSLRRDRWRSQ